MDLVLILDRSGSMSKELANLKTVAKNLLSQLDLTNGHAAVVSFSSSATVDIGLSKSHSALYTAIDPLVAHGGTNIVAAFTVGQSLLTNSRCAGYQ